MPGCSYYLNNENPLKSEVNRQLRAARPTAAQIRVAAAHIRRRRRGQELRPISDGVGARHQAISHLVAVAKDVNAKSRQQRVAEVRVVEDIEEIGAKLH